MRWIFAFQLVKLDSLAVYWNSSSEQYASLSNERLLVSTCTYNMEYLGVQFLLYYQTTSW